VTSNGKWTVFTDEKFKQKLKRKMEDCSFFASLQAKEHAQKEKNALAPGGKPAFTKFQQVLK